MTKGLPLIFTICACAMLTLVLSRGAAAQEAATAIVEDIKGTAFWRRNADERRERLRPKTQIARPLYPGEQVWCARGCVLRLRPGRDPILVPAGVWFTIPPVDRSRSDPFRLMIEAVSDVSGIKRGSPLRVFSPPDHGEVLPSPFVIRWEPTPRGCKFSLLITEVGGRKVWWQDAVDGSSGSLASRSAEKELKRFRAYSGQGPLELRVSDSCGNDSRVTFSVLTAEKERALGRDLAVWVRETRALIAHLGRASVYDQYGMFWHTAKEYEAALGLAPESNQLLLRTISANRQIGNFTRAGELKKRLEAVTRLP